MNGQLSGRTCKGGGEIKAECLHKGPRSRKSALHAGYVKGRVQLSCNECDLYSNEVKNKFTINAQNNVHFT